MNIYFETCLVDFPCEPGFSEKPAEVTFPVDVKSVEVALKGFTLNYKHDEHHHEHKEEKHEEGGDNHIASVQLGEPSIFGNTVSCPVVVETPKTAPAIERKANVLFIATD